MRDVDSERSNHGICKIVFDFVAISALKATENGWE